MKKIQLSSLLLGLGLLGGVGFGTTYIHQQANTNIKNVRLLVNNNSSKYACVINGNGQLALTNSNGQVIGYVSVGEMLTLGASSNGKTFVTVQETGIQGYLANSNIKDITSGINQSLVKLNRKGYIINVSTDVHVRANATMDSQVLADLSNNTNLTITGKQGNWIRVNVNGIKGYVFDEYIAEGSSINGGTIVVPNNTNIKTTSTSKNNKIVVNPSVIHNSNNKVNVNNTPAPVVHYENNTPVPAVHHENKTTSVAHHENNTPAPAVHHENKTTPVVHHENNTPAPAVHHENKTTSVAHHENNTPAPAVHHENKTTPVVHHENNTPAPAVHHENKTTPVVHHENNTPAPAVHHENKTTPVVHHENNTPAPAVHHENKTTPVVHHENNTPAPAVHHENKTTPVAHHENNTPAPAVHHENKTTPVVHHENNTPAPAVHHENKTTPVVHHENNTPAPAVHHENKTTPVVHHENNTPAPAVHHENKTTPVVHHENNTPAPAVHHENKTTPVVHHENNTPAPAVHHENKTTPVVHHENNTPAPAVHHENKTTPVVHHENNTPAPAVHHENKTTPVVHHENNTPAPAVHHKVIKTGIKVGSQKFYNIINEQMIKLTNEYRALHGLKPVKENSILTKMADWKTNECVETNTFSDYTPSGQTVFQQPQFKMYGNTPSEAKAFNENLAEAGISGGENGYFKVSTIQGFANQAFYDLIMSPAHKANILNQNSTEIGLSSKLYKNKNTLIIAQEFGTGIN